MAITRVKHISGWLRELACDMDPASGIPRNKAIAKALYEIALDTRQSVPNRLKAIEMIADRAEGKPLQTNVTAEMAVNPFDGIDTAKLEALKAKLLENNDPAGK